VTLFVPISNYNSVPEWSALSGTISPVTLSYELRWNTVLQSLRFLIQVLDQKNIKQTESLKDWKRFPDIRHYVESFWSFYLTILILRYYLPIVSSPDHKYVFYETLTNVDQLLRKSTQISHRSCFVQYTLSRTNFNQVVATEPLTNVDQLLSRGTHLWPELSHFDRNYLTLTGTIPPVRRSLYSIGCWNFSNLTWNHVPYLQAPDRSWKILKTKKLETDSRLQSQF
jgi:hypothetical protein